jgi:lipopolysaccharide export system protein LptA
MERGFKFMLRTGFVLLVLAGIGLIVWAGVAERPPEAGRAARIEESSAAGGGSGGEAAVQPEEPTAIAPVNAAEADQSGDESWTTPEEGQSDIRDFRIPLIDQQKAREEGQVLGRSMRAVADSNEKLVDVEEPTVDLYVQPADVNVGPVDVQLKQVRITADGAIVNQEDRVVRLAGNVVAAGEDFRITTDSVVYEGRGRQLTSDDPVHIRRFGAGDEEADSTAMVINGVGLDVDLAIENMVIRRDVEAKLFGVSDDFLAAGNGNGEEDAPAVTVESVIITASGRMTYAHVGRVVEFHDDVRVVSGERVLTCDHLQIALSDGEDEESMAVKDIVATGLVELEHEGQTARGDRLQWGNVTQTGTLTGTPAAVVSAEFDMQGEKLTFYRLNERFNCQGSGRLLWNAAPAPEDAGDAPADADVDEEEGWDVGPLSMSGDGPIRVDWTTSMTYQVDAGLASFGGGVRARQAGSSLDCEQLVLTFNAETRALEKIVAEENVRIHDAQAAGGRDVTCHKLVWDAVDNTVDLSAREGDVVNVRAGPNAIESARVVLDNARQSLESPVSGRLTVETAQGEPAEGAEEPGPPITITWSEAMSFVERPEPRASFRGSVYARREQQSIEGDRLDLDFDRDMNPVKITVRGGAMIDVESSGEPAAAERETEDATPLMDVAAARGGHWRFGAEALDILIPEERIETDEPGTLTVTEQGATTAAIAWEDRAHLDWQQNYAEFEGAVDAAMPGTQLKCARLKLDFDDQRELRNIWAEGGIEFQQERDNTWHVTAGSAQAVFAGASRLRQVIALDDVKVWGETNTLTADSVQLFLEQVEEAGDPQVVRAIAQGSVHVVYEVDDPTEAGGDRLEWRRGRDVYLLSGQPDAYVQRGRMKMTSDKMEVDRQTGIMQALPDARPVTTEFLVPLR